jgi:hypothetical protein
VDQGGVLPVEGPRVLVRMWLEELRETGLAATAVGL